MKSPNPFRCPSHSNSMLIILFIISFCAVFGDHQSQLSSLPLVSHFLWPTRDHLHWREHIVCKSSENYGEWGFPPSYHLSSPSPSSSFIPSMSLMPNCPLLDDPSYMMDHLPIEVIRASFRRKFDSNYRRLSECRMSRVMVLLVKFVM